MFCLLYAVSGISCSAAHVYYNTSKNKYLKYNYSEVRYKSLFVNKNNVKKLELQIKQTDIPSLGASGSVMGISTACAFLFPLDKVVYGRFYAIIPIPLASALYLGSDLLNIFIDRQDNIDHYGHVAGALGGLALLLHLWYNFKNGRVRSDIPLIARYLTKNWHSRLRYSQYFHYKGYKQEITRNIYKNKRFD